MFCVFDIRKQRLNQMKHETLSRKLDMSSVGQLQAEIIGQPGLSCPELLYPQLGTNLRLTLT